MHISGKLNGHTIKLGQYDMHISVTNPLGSSSQSSAVSLVLARPPSSSSISFAVSSAAKPTTVLRLHAVRVPRIQGRLCSGYTQCAYRGYKDHSYPAHEATSYWGSSIGNECTNYVAYAESTIYAANTEHYSLGGSAAKWASTSKANGVLVNTTPTVGSVAQWNAGDHGIGAEGHVAIVERTGPGYIVVSQQNIAGTANGYDWERINAHGTANQWEPYPDHFIHFVSGNTTRSDPLSR